MSGTEIAYGDICLYACAMQCPVSTQRMVLSAREQAILCPVLPQRTALLLSAYALATHGPLLTFAHVTQAAREEEEEEQEEHEEARGGHGSIVTVAPTVAAVTNEGGSRILTFEEQQARYPGHARYLPTRLLCDVRYWRSLGDLAMQ
eukprot:749597-Rhodomonas_salina.3